MKITLISLQMHPVALGLRYVSSRLKRDGHDVEMIFMVSKHDTPDGGFSESLVADLVGRLRDRDLIGMSLMTISFYRACALTRRIREAGVTTPIVWGGTHATVAPDECLEIADVVCVGEGEGPMSALAGRLEAGEDPKDVPGLGFRGGGPFGNARTIRNPVGLLERDLDAHPFPDYELETHWVAGRDRLVPARVGNLRGTLQRLRVLSTRGCPNRCTFCNNAGWRQIYKGKGPWVRMRSVDNVLDEIQAVRERFGTIRAINVVDDLFFVRDEAEIDEFAVKYAQRVNLPLELDAYPNTITEAKIRSLTRLPFRLISMGIESASPDTLQNIYNRPTPIENIVRSIELFHRYRIPAEYHYLVGNPYEPEENVVETMRFIASHHKGPANLRVFPLMFYPGTPLCERARADGLIEDRDERAYRHKFTGSSELAGHDYLTVWLRAVLYLRNVGLPSGPVHRLIDVVTHRGVRRCIDRPWLTSLAFRSYQTGRKLIRHLVSQPLGRMLRYLRRKRQPDAPGPRARDVLSHGTPA